MKFSIRDLLLVTVIVALLLGWRLHAEKLRAELDRAYEAQLQGEARAVTAEFKVKAAQAIIDQLNVALLKASEPAPNSSNP